MLTLTSAFASTSPSKFNIASMEMHTQTHRMGLNPFLTFYVDAMLNVDGDANVNVKCEHTLTVMSTGWHLCTSSNGNTLLIVTI